MVYAVPMNVEVLEEWIEYKFAPGPLLVVQGLANTHSYEEDLELLTDPESSRQWLTNAGLLAEGAGVSRCDQEDLLELREAIRSLLYANHDGTTDPEATKTLRRLAEEHPVGFKVTDEGKVELDLEPAASGGELIGQAIGIIARSQELDEWRRLKICPAEDCRWAFYDSSKNRGGTWCRMEVCGNRNKNRKYREAHSAAG